MLLWQIATIGVAITVLFQFIPWSFGWVEKINVMISRTLFWYFGHPLVYFWLMPAYMCWYICIPKIIGGKIFSDSMARLAFVLFIVFSFPVGFHHQLMEPGIAPIWKFIQVVLTFAVVVPSLMTAFAMFATFEQTGRAKGARGCSAGSSICRGKTSGSSRRSWACSSSFRPARAASSTPATR